MDLSIKNHYFNVTVEVTIVKVKIVKDKFIYTLLNLFTFFPVN